MKKLNAKGFTLIELLAVITIMGILMMVAIPTVSRTIENSRKDTFIDTAKSYVNGAKNMWAADNLKCGTYLSSAVANGTYYIEVDTTKTDIPVLLEQGGKSSWGSRDIKGHIRVVVGEATVNGNKTRTVKYYPVLSDDIHGVNFTTAADGTVSATAVANQIVSEELVRGNITMTGATYAKAAIPAGATTCIEV